MLNQAASEREHNRGELANLFLRLHLQIQGHVGHIRLTILDFRFLIGDWHVPLEGIVERDMPMRHLHVVHALYFWVYLLLAQILFLPIPKNLYEQELGLTPCD